MKAWHDHKGPIVDTKNGFDVIDCVTCGFKHLIPLPSSQDLDKIYRNEYYSREKPLYLERHREDLDWWDLVYAERYAVFEKELESSRRRILDVGSGPGFFLKHGKERGWETFGIEPSLQAVAHSTALGLDVMHEFLTPETAKALGLFDVIYLNQVLEHIPDPAGLLQLIKQMLTPGGLICLVVPNDYSPFQLALTNACGFEPWWVAAPHHINYFDFESLNRLVVKTGFEILMTDTTFPIDMFLLMGENYILDDANGRRCHGMRKNFEFNLEKAGLAELKQKLYRAMAKLGIGREVVTYARSVEMCE